MTWFFQGTEVTELPEECIGFVYLITNTLSGRKYIGKKLAKFSKTTYKTVKLKNGTKKKKKIPTWKSGAVILFVQNVQTEFQNI